MATPQEILNTYRRIIQRGFDEYISKDIRDAIANGLQHVFENAGSAGVSNDHVFESTTVRDNYFDPDRLTELRSGVPIFVQTGTAAAPVIMLQVWTGPTSPSSYDNTLWSNSGDIALSRYLTFDPDGQNGQGELQSSVAFYAPVLRANTGTLQLDNAIDLESNTDNVCIVGHARTERLEPITTSFNFTAAGSNPIYNERAAPSLIDVSMLMDSTFSSGSFTYQVTSDSNAFAFRVRPAAAGMSTLTVYFGTTDTGVRLVSAFNFEFTSTMINVETEIMLPNCVRVKPNENILVEYSGPNLAGHQYSSDPTFGNQSVPFFRIRRHAITVRQMATQNYVDNAVTAGNVSFTVQNLTSTTYTILDGDRNNHIRFTGTSNATWTLPAASGLASGWGLHVSADTNQITINRAGSDTIDGGTSLIVSPGDTVLLVRSSASAWLSYRIDGNATHIQGRAVATTAPTNGQVLTYNSTSSTYTPQTPSGGAAEITFEIQNEPTQSYAIVDGDRGQFLAYTGTSAGTWTLPVAAGLSSGWGLYVSTRGTAMTLSPGGSDTINGTSSLAIPQNTTVVIARSGTTTWLSYVIDGNALSIQGRAVSTSTPTDGQVLTYDGGTSTYVPRTPSTGGAAEITFTVQNEPTQSYTILDADRGEFLAYTGTSTGTWTLPAASGLSSGWGVYITARGAAITLSPNGSDTINGGSSLSIAQDTTYVLARSGSSTWLSYLIDGNALRIQGVAVASTAPTNGQVLAYNSTSTEYEPVNQTGSQYNFDVRSVTTQSYNILQSDREAFLRYTGTSQGSWTLPAASTLNAGYGLFITGAGHDIVLSRTGSDTINGGTSITINRNETYVIGRTSASAFNAQKIDGDADSIQGTDVSTTAPTNGQVLKYSSANSQYEPADDESGMTSVNYGVNAQSGSYTVASSDRGQYLRYTGTSDGTWTMPAASGLSSGFGVFISTNTNQVTLNRSGSDTIDGGTSVVIPIRSTYLISRSSNSAYVSYVIDGNALAIQNFAVADTTPSNGQVLKYSDTNNRYEPADETGGGTVPVLSLHNFSINIPSRVDVNTNLGTRNLTYSITNYTQLTGLQLQIGGTNFAAITNPTSDGQHTVSVDLSTVDTSSATTLVFRLQANGSINSNTQSVQVANAAPQELLYWGVESDNVASTFDTSAAQSQTNFSGDITIPTFSGSMYLKIAYPATEPAVTQLRIGGVNQLGAFTLSSDALTIGGENYDVLVSNNALLGNIVSGTVVTIIR